MIDYKDGRITIKGGMVQVLAELGHLCASLGEQAGKDQVLEACLIGLYSDDPEAIFTVREKLKREELI